jgi:hypothetical protein
MDQGGRKSLLRGDDLMLYDRLLGFCVRKMREGTCCKNLLKEIERQTDINIFNELFDEISKSAEMYCQECLKNS